MAALERISGWGVHALRMGILLLLQQCIRDMAKPGANREVLVKRATELLQALERMPWE